jgi:hypothetical protein
MQKKASFDGVEVMFSEKGDNGGTGKASGEGVGEAGRQFRGNFRRMVHGVKGMGATCPTSSGDMLPENICSHGACHGISHGACHGPSHNACDGTSHGSSHGACHKFSHGACP